jgi:uncharacterized phage protein (TIGR01671 family)
MREIKFRGRQLLEHSGMGDTAGKWLYGNVVIESTQTLMYWQEGSRMFCERVVRETVGEWSSLKDKNDTEIYEGDVLQDTGWSDRRIVFAVEFGEQEYADGAYQEYAIGYNIDPTYKRYKVIGNIYENPELLK